MDVSIIIVNYNTADLIVDCIESINRYTKDISFEIIVVDNNSSDKSCSVLEEKFNNIILIKSKDNLGFGRANNLGALTAKGKYLLLLNSDILLIDNSIKKFFDFMEEQPSEVAACGGNLYYPDMRPNFSYSLYYPSLWSILCYRLHLSFLLNNENFNFYNKDQEVSIIIGADLFIKKQVYNEVKGFDPDYFMYVEEGDMQLRIKKRGYIVKSLPSARFLHLQGASSNTLFKIKEEIKSYKLYFKKHYFYKYYFYIFIEMFNCLAKYSYSLIKRDVNMRNMYIDVLKFLIYKK